jgi:hypothetical protein
MIRKSQSSIPGHVRVIFELPSCIWADRISVTGDFNRWDENATPMRQNRNGVWQAVLDLPAGEQYEFRYLIDGQWRTDYHADGYADNIYGSQNSLIVVDLPELMTQAENGNSLIRESLPLHSTMPGVAPHRTLSNWQMNLAA